MCAALLLAAVLSPSLSIVLGAASAPNDKRLKSAEAVLTDLSGSFDKGIPESLLQKASCVVIIPSVKRAAMGIGGQYGRGYMLCRKDGPKTWSAPAGIRIEGGSIGFQLGGSDTDVILLVMNSRGADRLLSSQFTIGAEAAVAAGPIGRQASAQTDATMRAEILAWSQSRGIYAGISLQGSTLRQDDGENRELYGSDLKNRDIVTGDVKPPAAAAGLIALLSKY